MSKIHNIIRTIGLPGSEEFELPPGYKLQNTVYLGPTNEQEKAAGFFKILYVLIPEVDAVRRAGRPPKNE